MTAGITNQGIGSPSTPDTLRCARCGQDEAVDITGIEALDGQGSAANQRPPQPAAS